MQALRELLGLYCELLFPVAVITAWTLVVFGVLSYAVPRLLCKDAALASVVCPCLSTWSSSIAPYMHWAKELPLLTFAFSQLAPPG